MKIYVFLLVVGVIAAVAFALPIEDEDGIPLESLLANEGEKAAPVEEHYRERRATCDLLSGLGVNHSACAAHCIARGKKGGSCNSRGVCVCRKERLFG